MKTLKLLFLFLIGITNSKAQISIDGFVKTIQNSKIIGANINIKYNNESFSTVTDSLGYYILSIPNGEFQIEASHVGFIEKTLFQNSDQNLRLDFLLEPNAYTLEEVAIVKESQKSISILPNSKLSFNPKKLSSIPSLFGTIDIIKVLQLTPGVQNAGDANGYLYVRGGDPGHNLMMYSGVPVYGMAHLLGVFPFYNSDHIDSVSFDKSNSDSKYGGRLGATVLITTQKKIPEKFSLQGNIGLLVSQISLATPLGLKTAFFFSGRKTYIDEIVGPVFEKSNENQDVQKLGYGFNDFNFTFVTALNDKHQISVDVFKSSDKFKISDSKLALNGDLKWGNQLISSTWDYKISGNKTMKNILYFSEYRNQLQILQESVDMNISSSIKDFGWTSSIEYDIKKIHLESGLQYSNFFLQPQKISVTNLGSENINKQDIPIEASSYSLFTNAKMSFSDCLNIVLGFRLNSYDTHKSSTKYLHFEPRISINYVPSKFISFFGTYIRQNQYLNLITTSNVGIPTDFWVGASDGIPAQSSNEFSLGSVYNINNKYNFSLTGFHRSMKDLLEYPFGLTQFNEITTLKDDIFTGNGSAYGIETMLKKDSGKLKGWLSYTLSKAIREFEFINNGDPYFAKYDRRHNLSIVGTYDFNRKWTLGATQIFSSGNRFTMPTSWYFINNSPVKEYSKYNNEQIPSYIRTDLSINYFFFKTSKRESAINFSIYNTFIVNNPLYIFLKIAINNDNENVALETQSVKLYTILPSISWRFKF